MALQDQTGPFDVIVGDVFHDVAVPYHLVTRELARLARQRLQPDGLYVMNLVDAFPDPRLLKALLKTLATEFRFVDVWLEGMPQATRATYVISASNEKRLPEMVSARRGFERTWLRVTDAILEIGTPQQALPLLTDDYAPVERLIADLLIGENK